MEFKKKQDLLKTLSKPTKARQSTLDSQKLLQQIGQLTLSEQMPQRITLLQQALTLVNRQIQPELWGTLQFELGISLVQSPLGSHAENCEQAIKHYQLASTIYTRKAFPIDWALIQNNLAYIYSLGNQLENIEKTIKFSIRALEIYTHTTVPKQWALAQNMLGNAYRRIKDNQGKNVELAIYHLNQALEINTCTAFLLEAAHNHYNLALAYSDRIKGSRAENIEQVIRHYIQALDIYNHHTFYENRADIQNKLGNAYSDRILGGRAENIEQTISYYTQALEIYTREIFPKDWADIQNNLASAYRNRIIGNPAENIERAMQLYIQALEISSYEEEPYNWAITQNNLANAYLYRITGNQAENIEQSISLYTQVLSIHTYTTHPEQWADAQNNLANAYAFRIVGNKAENLEQAIKHYTLAFDVYTFDTFPEKWAMVHNNLGLAYARYTKGNQAENIKLAIHHYTQALEVRSLHTFPRDHRLTQKNLGHLYFDNERWTEVDKPYQSAISMGKQLLKLALTPEAQQAEINETDELFARTSYANLHMGYVGPAFFTLEQGKTQLLTQTLALYEADVTMLTPAQKEELDQVREGVRMLETELRLPEGSPGRLPTLHLTEKLKEARATLDQLIDTLRGLGHMKGSYVGRCILV